GADAVAEDARGRQLRRQVVGHVGGARDGLRRRRFHGGAGGGGEGEGEGGGGGEERLHADRICCRRAIASAAFRRDETRRTRNQLPVRHAEDCVDHAAATDRDGEGGPARRRPWRATLTLMSMRRL